MFEETLCFSNNNIENPLGVRENRVQTQKTIADKVGVCSVCIVAKQEPVISIHIYNTAQN